MADLAETSLWPLLVYSGAVVLLVAAMLVISHFLGQRHTGRATGQPFESGMPVTGSARLRLPIQFYLVAMFFVVFDLESIFIFAWAISYDRLGWSGYIALVVFIVVLFVALAYLWRLGALDWGTTAVLKQRHREQSKI